MGRAIIISTILALGVAGSALAGSAMPAAAANTPATSWHPKVITGGTNMYYHG